MRFLFGSDILGNQKIFGITVSATNCTNTGDSTIAVGGTASLLFTADAGYELPTTITVVGASYTWDKDTGVLILSAVTQTVTVTVEAAEIPLSQAIYGVSGLYASSPSLTRTDDAVGMSAAVNSSTGLVSSDFDSVFPYNEMVKTTIGTNKFVYVPSMWFRIGTDGSGNITDVAVSNQQGAGGNWYQTEAFYYGAYGADQATDFGGDRLTRLRSISGSTRTAGITRAQARTYASNVGSGYFQRDLYHNTIMLFLWWIEFANKNSQSIMRGRDATYGGTLVATGGTDGLTTPSGFNTSTGQMRWHYIEDFVGNVFEFIDGIVGNGIQGSVQYVTADPSKFNDTGSEYNQLSYYAPAIAYSDPCTAAFGWDGNNPFLIMPKEIVGDNTYTTYFCDYGGPQNLPAYYSGGAYDYSSASHGVSAFLGAAASYSRTFIGARLLYKPVA